MNDEMTWRLSASPDSGALGALMSDDHGVIVCRFQGQTLLWEADATPALRIFALWCAEQAIEALRTDGIEPHAVALAAVRVARQPAAVSLMQGFKALHAGYREPRLLDSRIDDVTRCALDALQAASARGVGLINFAERAHTAFCRSVGYKADGQVAEHANYVLQERKLEDLFNALPDAVMYRVMQVGNEVQP